MKFFIDTASVSDIREAAELGLLDGVTTNPTLLSKEEGDPREILRQIDACTDCEICQVRCPADLPVIDMLRAAVPGMKDMIRIWEAQEA